MADNLDAERTWLSFADDLPELRAAPEHVWLRVRRSLERENEDRHDSAAFIPTKLVRNVLKDYDWDDHDHGPTVWSGGDLKDDHYYRMSDTGIEPLVIEQSFSGLRPEVFDLLEEFRLFHNLYFDRSANEYALFDEAGRPVPVVKVSPNWESVEVLARSARQFIAWKGAHLALYVQWHRYSEKTLEELGLQEKRGHVMKDATSTFGLTIVDCDWRDGYRTLGSLLGKVIVPPLKRQESDWGPYELERQYQSFIVGVDKDGRERELSCAPEVSESKFLVAVWFRVEVLKKYQSEPERYEVTDGGVRCQGRWHLPVDNDHKDHVAVFLGDLRMLPEAEQLHWRGYNIAPVGRLSETAFRRSFNGEWVSSERPEHRFARTYRDFMASFQKRGFQIIRPLAPDDEHCLTTLHVPYTESVMDFDEEIVKLTKLLVDSINDTELEKSITVEKDERSLSKLEKYLVGRGRTDHEPHVALLRDLQRYRSQNAAHRRGKEAYKSFAKLVPGVASRRKVLSTVLEKATALLGYLLEIHETPPPGSVAPSAG